MEHTSLTRTVEHDGVSDEVAVEEPLEIRVDGVALAVTMRTPGHDEELALGFLHGEGLITEAHAAGLTDDLANNTIEVEGPLARDPSARSFYTTSSCGVCGKGALEEVAVHCDVLPPGRRSTAPCSPTCPSACASLASPAPADCTPPASSPRTANWCTCARTWGATTRWTRSSAAPSPTACSRSTVTCCASAAGSRSSSCRRPPSPARRSSSASAHPPPSPVSLAQDRGLTLAGFARQGDVNVYTGQERVV